MTATHSEQLQGGGVVPRQAHNLETPVQVRPLLPVPGEGDDPSAHPPADVMSSLPGAGAGPAPGPLFDEERGFWSLHEVIVLLAACLVLWVIGSGLGMAIAPAVRMLARAGMG